MFNFNKKVKSEIIERNGIFYNIETDKKGNKTLYLYDEDTRNNVLEIDEDVLLELLDLKKEREVKKQDEVSQEIKKAFVDINFSLVSNLYRELKGGKV